MKKIKFRGLLDGKKVSGYWFADIRPNNAQKIAERLVKHRLTKFVSVAVDFKTTMIKCGE